ncbi:MAG: hypothetical protein AAB403_24680, partial [Planctomycetota bacterium]
MSDETEEGNGFVDAVFAYFGADDMKPTFKGLLLVRTVPMLEEWEEIFSSDMEDGDNKEYCRKVHDAYRQFLADSGYYLTKKVKAGDPRHADLVEIAEGHKVRVAAAAAAPVPAAPVPAPADPAAASVPPAPPAAAPAAAAPSTTPAAPAAAAPKAPSVPGVRRVMADPDEPTPDPAPAEPEPSTKPSGPAPKGRDGSTPPKVDPKHASTTVRPASKTEVVDD